MVVEVELQSGDPFQQVFIHNSMFWIKIFLGFPGGPGGSGDRRRGGAGA